MVMLTPRETAKQMPRWILGEEHSEQRGWEPDADLSCPMIAHRDPTAAVL
jgi:hypothetical protein